MQPDDYNPVTVNGKTAVVLGGTSGIGRAIANCFAADGADVVATSRGEDHVVETADELRDAGADTVEVTCDVTEPETLTNVREVTEDVLGDIDVLVNSPSYIARQNISDVEEDEWEYVLDIHLKASRRAIQEFAPAMGTGCIINMASLSSQIAIPELAAYSSAKGGIDALTRISSQEFGPDVRVNAIRPGFIQSDQTQGTYTEGTDRYEEIVKRTTTDRLGYPEEIGGAAIYLASDAASYTNGEIITVDDGFTASAFNWD
ncbi:SDR family NAD(P)-dependent oxidoreductase [Halarchaeum salinum]|uniref:Glucose 1-dehydrogenase n=1 Tax=Halarchaeum salinum TaxID=489912 RepID=A0AAV3SC59_9EURY